MKTDISQQGFLQRSAQAARLPTESRIHCRFFTQSFYMLDVPPWGIILPVEVANEPNIRFSLEVESIGLPKGTMLGMRWTPSDGNNSHRATLALNGDENRHALLPIDNGWLQEAESQHVLIEHEIMLPDGTVTIGAPVTVLVSRKLVFGEMTLDGLEHLDILDPALYPNGIHARYTPIEHIADYHRVTLLWGVYGVKPEWDTISFVLFQEELVLPGKPGEPYEFFIPPEAYTGYEDPQYCRIWARALAGVKQVPAPMESFDYSYGGYQFDVLPPGKRK
ncbi:hypothetical protein ACIP1T_05310 [Pseudomonas japonica]|uniref:hypothetical protein n=1 Tax=Pseudomonas japonica TaxID=256466 RepID=UPI0037F52968